MKIYEAAKRLGLDEETVMGVANRALPWRAAREQPSRHKTKLVVPALNRMSQLTDEEFAAIERLAEKERRVRPAVESVRAGVVRKKRVTARGAPEIVVEPAALERVLYEHGRGQVVSPWKVFLIRIGSWGAICAYDAGRVDMHGCVSPEGEELPPSSYPPPRLRPDKELKRSELTAAFESIVRAIATVGVTEERRESDVRVLMAADAEREDRTVYVYLSKEWLEKTASHCVLIRKGASPHKRRGHSRRQRVGPGKTQVKEAWVSDTSVKGGESWPEYRVSPGTKKTRPA